MVSTSESTAGGRRPIGRRWARGTAAVRLTLALVAVGSCSPALAEPFYFAVFDSTKPPFAFFDSQRSPDKGIVPDLGRAIADELGMTAEFRVYPRRRIELATIAGQAHALCNMSRDWSTHPDKFAWSRETYVYNELLVQRADTGRPIRSLDDVAGLVVAGVFGHLYPTLDPKFAARQAQRVDERHLEGSLRAVKTGLADAAIGSDLEFAWLLRDPAMAARFRLSPVIVSGTSIRCALSPKAPVDLKAFDAAIERLQARGEISRILARYAAPRR